MSDSARPRDPRQRWASDHERARQRAGERLSLPLPAAENTWLDRHLRGCAPCASVAADYAAEQASLRGLQEPLPPRDMWARTAAALDRAERQAGRDIRNPSVFPGRGNTAGSRGARSIRGLRAEQRASAFRSLPRALPPRLAMDGRRRAVRPAGLGWVAPFGALAVLAIVIVVGGSAMLTGSGLAPARGPFATIATLAANVGATPFATPIQVGAGEVAWLTPMDDGSYSLNFASVDHVCPANAQPDCAPIAPASPRQLPTVRTTLHTVLRSPSHRQLVVVTTGTKKRSGGSVIVFAVPTPVPAASQAPTAAPGTASPSAPASDVAVTSSAPAVSASGGTSSLSPTEAASNSGSSAVTPGAPGSAVPPASAGASTEPLPTAAAAAPSATDANSSFAPASPVETPGTTAAASPSAVETPSANPSDSSLPSQPQPTAAAVSIISGVVIVGETASYSPDGTMLAFSARPADGSQGPDIYLWRPGDDTAHPLTTDHASVFSGWLNNQLLGSRALNATGEPASTSPADSSPAASLPSDATATPAASLPAGSGPASDALSVSGSAGAEPSAAVASDGPLTPSGSASASADASNAEGAASMQSVTGVSGDALPRSFVLDPVTGLETNLVAPAWRPVVDPTGRFVAYWAGSLRYEASSLTWIPDRGAIVLASWTALRGTDPGAILAPVPMLDNGSDAIPAGEWDIRWDESGSHIALWTADASNPELGRLTLLTIDAAGRVDPRGVSLRDAPALAGFSMENDRLAWATPPGQDGEGSRLQVLAWSGENAGKIDGQPVSGGDAVVVVR